MSAKLDIGQGRQDVSFTTASLGCYTMVPCTVIAFWLLEELGPTTQLINKIKTLIKFYGYSEILNMPANTPDEILKALEK
jgi:hypothetical protein